MRLPRYALLPVTALLFACGAEIAPSSQEPPHDGTGGGTPPGSATGATSGTATSGPPTVIGELYALTANMNGQPTERFDLNLQKMPTPDANQCARATATAGSCCYFGPTPPPPTQLPGSGGAPATESSAGTVTLTTTTSSAPIETFDYAKGAYLRAPANYTSWMWKPGDTLQVSAAGGDIGAFSVSAPALVPPTVTIPSTITRTSDLAITWRPDSNAESFSVSFSDGSSAVLACFAPDASGTLTVEASMLAYFQSNARLQGVAMRDATRYTQLSTGRVAFKTMGWFSFDATAQ